MGELAPQLPDFEAPARPLADELVNDPGIDRILNTVRGHLGVDIAFVARYVEGEQRELTHVSSDLDLPMGPGYRNPREEGYCWHILNGRLPELIQDPADHPLCATMDITDFLPVGCHINTPLRLADGTVWGSFCALGRKPDRSMTQRDLDILRSFAGLVGERIQSSLEREMTHEQARSRVEAMLDGHAVTIFQQPIVALDTGRPRGVECLSRFPDVTKRGPDAWFEDAELVGLGTQLEMTAVRCALETLPHIPEGVYAAVNVSPETVASGTLRAELEQCEPANLVVEITEHCQVADFAALRREIEAIKAHAKIAIDDVGTGYSGLRHIVDLQPDILKMDMVLTRDIHMDPARRAMTAAMVQFAGDIGCTLVAEGIETAEELDVMKSLGVDCGQGYYFSRPLPVVAAQQYLLGAGRASD
ncbi:sensor domain-containing phosphodiesterase [Aurantiacibacter spongiae]|nr:EAL domain-containing protein [Aurantiacibacter spongiae]